jgi:hypothetical protein
MLIQKRIESFKLFNKEFRPGLLCDGKYCIAIKCKKFSKDYNYFENNLLYVCDDKQLLSRNCFCKNISEKYPVRVCIYTEKGYNDIGWGLPFKITKNGKYIVDTSEEVQERYKGFSYPVYPGEINFKGKLTMFDEWIYESKLEAKYAKLFKGLDVPFIQQPPPLPSSSGEWWRIDFLLWPNDCEKMCFVEIKPGRPYEEEERKCETAAFFVSPTPVILLYGEMAPPFVYDQSKERPCGVRGLRWVVKDNKVCRDNVVLKYKNTLVIEPRGATLDVSWSHPHLMYMYSESNNETDMTFF